MAEKKSAISYESIMKSLKAREFAPVYILMGDEPFYIDKVCDYISETVLQLRSATSTRWCSLVRTSRLASWWTSARVSR